MLNVNRLDHMAACFEEGNAHVSHHPDWLAPAGAGLWRNGVQAAGAGKVRATRERWGCSKQRSANMSMRRRRSLTSPIWAAYRSSANFRDPNSRDPNSRDPNSRDPNSFEPERWMGDPMLAQ